MPTKSPPGEKGTTSCCTSDITPMMLLQHITGAIDIADSVKIRSSKFIAVKGCIVSPHRAPGA